MPRVSELAHIATQAAESVHDVPSCAYVACRTVLENLGPDAEDHVLEGVPGVLWRGSFTDVLNGLWPDLRNDGDTRRQINNYLRGTENMLCIKRHSPLWWLRREWNDVDLTVPRGFRPVRSGRALAQPRTETQVAEVVTSYRCGECGFLAETKQGLGGHRRSHVERPAPKTSRRLTVADPPPPADSASEAADAVAEMVERSRALERENTALRADVDRLNERIAAINRVLAGR